MIRPAVLISGLTLVSRLLGVARDALFALVFGLGATWDVFVVAFAVPNMFRRLFGEGALTSAFVPSFVGRLERDGPDAAWRLLWATAASLTLILGGILLAVEIGLSAARSGLPEGSKAVAILATLQLTVPYALLICLAAILGAALNAVNHFAIPAVGPVLMNLTLIAGALFCLLDTGIDELLVLAWAVLAGGVIQLGACAAALFARGALPVRPGLREAAPVWRAAVPAVAALLLVQANEVLDSVIAEICVPGDGAVGALYYANRLNQLPLALVGFSVATAAFPLLSRAAAAGDGGAYAGTLSAGVRLALALAVPAAAGLFVLAPPIVRLLFERGSFTEAASARVALVVRFYALGIPFYAAVMVLSRAFYAKGDMWTPVRANVAAAVLNVLLNLALVHRLGEAGIALATSLSAMASFGILAARIRLRARDVAGPGAGFAASSVAMAAAVGAGSRAWAAPADTARLAAWILCWVTVGGALYAALVLALRVPVAGRYTAGRADPGLAGSHPPDLPPS